MNAFINYLNGIVDLSRETQEAINKITVHRQLGKNTTLLSNGEVCNEFHFLASGLARVFYYKDGKEVTAWFAAQGGIASAIDSLFTGSPSIYNVETLEDSEIFSLQYRKLEPVFQNFPIVERLGRLMVTSNYLLLDERMKLYAFCTAEERYERLLQQLPDIFQRTKLAYVASYLGITQEHLSRIRAKYKNRQFC
ncbi:Crp/Fnr family transcriptional regulator [Dyadobacter sp. BHUBP1]|uniref:Crp/Fnr family transcriptional regulator n=1 Tax=Dyadobacter sp. BHUBP1 TaxID=3424178 RepID=UPI003D34F623